MAALTVSSLQEPARYLPHEIQTAESQQDMLGTRMIHLQQSSVQLDSSTIGTRKQLLRDLRLVGVLRVGGRFWCRSPAGRSRRVGAAAWTKIRRLKKKRNFKSANTDVLDCLRPLYDSIAASGVA